MDVIKGHSSDQILEGVTEENACFECDGTGVVFTNGSRDTEVMCERCEWTGIDPLTRPAPDDDYNDDDYRRVYWDMPPWAQEDYY